MAGCLSPDSYLGGLQAPLQLLIRASCLQHLSLEACSGGM